MSYEKTREGSFFINRVTMPRQDQHGSVCPICKTHNSYGANLCQNCRHVLVTSGLLTKLKPITTEEIAKDNIAAAKAESPPNPTAFAPATLALFVAGQSQPIIIGDLHEIVLGRYVDEGPAVTVMFDDDLALASGVSRRHAKICHRDGVFTIQDMASLNGTWVNETKLNAHDPHPLQNGDQVQLGQLTIYVYFKQGDEPTA